jgi:sulfide dehydrogenase cytochrome subunit
MHLRIQIAAILLSCIAASSALAQNATTLSTRSLAATCAACHGTDGRTIDGSAIPALAGMPRDYMLTQLKAFKDGSRPATVMHQLSKGFSEQQLETVASYFAALKR